MDLLVVVCSVSDLLVNELFWCRDCVCGFFWVLLVWLLWLFCCCKLSFVVLFSLAWLDSFVVCLFDYLVVDLRFLVFGLLAMVSIDLFGYC